MNTAQLKRFAQAARRKLMEQVGAKLDFVLSSDSPELREKFRQTEELRKELQRTGKAEVIEKVAYTWFNRLVALRYMDVNDYQPSGIRVITPANGYTQPQAITEAKQGNIPEEWRLDREKVFNLLDGRIPASNPQNEAFRMMLVAACNHLNTVFPFLFEKIDDYSELLLPDDLTSPFSIVHDVIEGMASDDCQEVEVMGWLYQFYISEEKDRLINAKKKYKANEIAPVTQLFTPNWIVRYMVDNTLGQLWKEISPTTNLTRHLEFYIKPADESVIPQRSNKSPEEITFFDPCSGSGHILVYAFDVFYRIYEEAGYNPSEIPGLIITKNLYGAEIDERAAQLAGFALMMKGRERHSRFLRRPVIPNILTYQNFDYDPLFENASVLGSLIKVDQNYLRKLKEDERSLFNILDKQRKKQAELLSSKYDVVVTNPPYMNTSVMPDYLKAYVETNYAKTKSDLFSTFILRCLELSKKEGFTGNMTPFVWMFISSYEALRKEIIKNYLINNLIQLEYSGFEGATVPICTFTLRNKNTPQSKSNYIRLSDFKGSQNQAPKTLEAIANPDCGWFYTADQKDFEKIPGISIGYWLSEKWIDIFDKQNKVGDSYRAKQGMATTDNNRFIRCWYEVEFSKIGLKLSSYSQEFRFFPFNKGGGDRKWIGYFENVLDYSNDGKILLDLVKQKYPRISDPEFVIKNRKEYFKDSVSWSKIGSTGLFSFRYYPKGFIFNDAANAFFDLTNPSYLLGLLNSVIGQMSINALNPTLNKNINDIHSIPIIRQNEKKVENIVDEICRISLYDWDSSEVSWNYNRHMLSTKASMYFKDVYLLYKSYRTNQFFGIHQKEEELNRIFISIYDLIGELMPDIPLEKITILQQELDRNALTGLNQKLKRDPITSKVLNYEEIELPFDAQEIMAQFVSYAVGCMFGRYSLDKPGLILANQGETLEDYLRIVGGGSFTSEEGDRPLSFLPDEDNVIPVLDDDWFEDDITGRFKKFLKASFGEDHFKENIDFVEECLGRDIRTWFVRDFYPDHVRRYKKRPIYWMFSSPRGNFNALIYMHRYTPDTVSHILNGYLRQLQDKLRMRKQHLQHVQVSGTNTERTQALRESERIEQVLMELHGYERDILYPLAAERVSIDLDDGVLVNYNRFGKAVKEVAGVNDAATKKKVKAFDWVDTSNIK